MATLTTADRQAIAQAATRAADAAASQDALSLEQLLALSREELDAYFAARGVELDWERMEDALRRALGPEILQMNRGIPLSDAQVQALATRVEKALASTARSVANYTMSKMEQTAILAADDRPPDQAYMVWISVGNGCPDCRDRHGTVFAADAWAGMAPCDGTTVCGDNCRCKLRPTGNPGAGREGLTAAA